METFVVGLIIGLIIGSNGVMWFEYITELKEHRRLVNEKKNRPVAYGQQKKLTGE